MPLTQETFAAVVLEDIDGRWELHQGKLREKPSMSVDHNQSARLLVRQLTMQLDPNECQILHNAGHTLIPGGNSYVPDVAILPVAILNALTPDRRRFEAYWEPLPLVVEIWSPSTGSYDIDAKIPGYRARGDAEIWRLHPFDRTHTIWRRQPDGSYAETVATGGAIRLHALPDVTIALDALFVGG